MVVVVVGGILLLHINRCRSNSQGLLEGKMGGWGGVKGEGGGGGGENGARFLGSVMTR